MIPQSLTIKGLYSYQKEQFIDFKQLLQGQLFGIFGSVGCGKSSILEAITFALYGETERLNKRERNYNMMNLKSDELLIDFTFLNPDEKEYRFTVQAKRHKTDFEQVRTYQRKAYEKSEGQWIPIEVSQVEQITGLSYENFRRTIIIPQGKFQEFLQLKPADRTTMMKELFNLDKYEFYGQVAELEKRNKEQLDTLTGKLSNFQEIDPEVISKEVAEQTTLNEQVETHSKELKNQQEKVQILNQLKELFDEVNTKEKQVAELLKLKADFDLRKQKLEKYEQVKNAFGNLLEQQQEAGKEMDAIAQKRKFTLSEKTSMEREQLLVKEQFAGVKSDYEKTEHRKQEVADLKEWIKVLEAEKEINSLSKRIAIGNEKVDTEKELKAGLEAGQSKLDQQIIELKMAIPDGDVLMKVGEWFARKNGIVERQMEGTTLISERQRALQQIAGKLQLAVAEALKPLISFGMENPNQALDGWKSIKRKLTEDQADLQSRKEHLILQKQLGEFASSLHDGKPCPLCGSESHPHVVDVEDVSSHETELQKEQNQLQNHMNAVDKAITNSQLLLQEETGLIKQIEEYQAKGKAYQQQLEELRKTFVWDGFDSDNEPHFLEVKQNYADQQKDLKGLEDQRTKKEEALKAARENVEKFEKLLQEIKTKRTVALTEKETALQRIQNQGVKQSSTEKPLVAERIKQLEASIQQTEKAFRELDEKFRRCEKQLTRLDANLQNQAEALSQWNTKKEGLDTKVSTKLHELGFSEVNQVNEVLKVAMDIPQERKEIDQFSQQLYAAEKAFAEVKLQTSGKTYDAQSHHQQKIEMEQHQKMLEELKGQQVRIAEALKRLQDDLKTKKTLQNELKAIEQRAENLKTMKQLFKGSGFVNYVSTVYLQNLCNAANERFHKLTRQQLMLEVDENNNFQVRDFMNNGRMRSVKTLSGGQTFQASLSLALALAGSVQQQAGANQNFFFLDEGFGSLDRDSLQIVFDTLKSLRHENRIVGVISHVEEMQQEIDMHIRVTKDEELGSLVKGSWE